MVESFINKFSLAFGKKEALMLKLAGLTEGELHAEGSWVYTASGKKWLDFGSFGIHLLGHRHSGVVKVAARQLNKMGLSTKILGNQMAAQCAASILNTMPGKMNRVTFANSGAESVEIAIKTAMLFTGKNEFIALKYSFHGKTTGAYRLTYQSTTSPEYQFPGFKVHFVNPEDFEFIRKIFKTNKIAGMIVEPLQGEGGINPIPKESIKEFRNLCDCYDSLLIIDEIQTGLGRCGELWYAVSEKICPDILLIGKTLGGGIVPISAAVFSERVNAPRCSDPLLNASSFAGGAFACSIAMKVIEIVSQEKFLADVRKKGEFCKNYLKDHLKDNSIVKDIRGKGLMLGIEFLSTPLMSQVITKAIKEKLLLSFCLVRAQVLRIYPPAVTSYADLKWGLDSLSKVIEKVSFEEFSKRE